MGNLTDKLYRLNRDAWLKDNPGKTEEDYRRMAAAETQEIQERNARWEQYRIERKAEGIAQNIWLFIQNVGIPLGIAWALSLFIKGLNILVAAFGVWVILTLLVLFFRGIRR